MHAGRAALCLPLACFQYLQLSVVPNSGQTKQRGQALVFSLVTLTIIILVMVAMYTMGQQSINKMKLQNTADAAAYSAVMAEARDYNFSAYTNRAVIANQVAVAQVVGLTSWARNYSYTYNGKYKDIPKILSGLGGPMAKFLWDTPVKFYKGASKTIGNAFDNVGPTAAKMLDGLIFILNTSQMVYHYGTALTVGQTIGLDPATVIDKVAGLEMSDDIQDMLSFNPAYNIIKLNDPKAGLSAPGVLAGIIHLVQWITFTERKDPNLAKKDGDAAERMAQVTLDSLDGFSKNRSTKGGGPGNDFPEMMYLTPAVVDPTRFIPYQNGALIMFLWHRGGTELKKIGDKKQTWSAMDATGFFGVGIFWISILGIPIPIPIPIPFIPMGMGAAQSGPSSNLNTTNNFGTSPSAAYGGVYKSVNTAAAAAEQKGRGAGTSLDTSSRAGLQKYFDVKKLDKDNLTGPSLMLEIEKEDSAIPTSNSVSSGQFTMTNGTQSGYMRSLSKAQVYFARPPKLWARGDSKTELGSLYSPYWQARLMPNTFIEQYISLNYHLW